MTMVPAVTIKCRRDVAIFSVRMRDLQSRGNSHANWAR
jgi:hypothetical protein